MLNAKKRIHILLTCLLLAAVLLIPSTRPIPTRALTYNVGTYFSVDISTYLSGTSGDYEDYSETERETRYYEVIDVTGNRVTFNYNRTWTYSDSEGGHQTKRESVTFMIDANTRRYLDNTTDGDPDYYIFDYTWIRIDPSTPKGAKITILGHEFAVNGKKIVDLDLFNSMELLEVTLVAPYTYSVNNTDYDPDGELVVTVTEETYYYDPVTGYIILSSWKANGQTSVGDFHWSESIHVTEASFPLPFRPDVVTQRYALLVTYIVVLIGGILAFIYFYNRRRVTATIAMLEGKKSFPMEKKDTKVTAWRPMQMSYQTLLDVDMDRSTTTTLGLNDGIHVVISTRGELGIVDTKQDRKLESVVIPSNDDNLRLLYQLALGIAPNDRDDLNALLSAIPELNTRLKLVRQFAPPDEEIKHTLIQEMIKMTGTVLDQQEVNAMIGLLSRRKVLDYSYGQAPLTVQSHLRKVHMVLEHDPKKVLLVGDDDLLSISLARKGIQVFVLDIDPYTCALIYGIAEEEGLDIHLFQVDMRDPLPPDLPSDFDMFVGDPDFTVESFALFLVRGLSRLKIGGIGLINFENKWWQRYRARKILEYLKVDIVDVIKEPWNYLVVRNSQEAIYRYYYGKTTIVDYKQDFILAVARFSSIMFVIKRTSESRVLLDADDPLAFPDAVIYDHDD